MNYVNKINFETFVELQKIAEQLEEIRKREGFTDLSIYVSTDKFVTACMESKNTTTRLRRNTHTDNYFVTTETKGYEDNGTF